MKLDRHIKHTFQTTPTSKTNLVFNIGSSCLDNGHIGLVRYALNRSHPIQEDWFNCDRSGDKCLVQSSQEIVPIQPNGMLTFIFSFKRNVEEWRAVFGASVADANFCFVICTRFEVVYSTLRAAFSFDFAAQGFWLSF